MSNAETKKSKKIFLILGISREKRNWNHPIQVLQSTLPDYEVIALDNPGVGQHHKIPVPLSIDGHIDFLKKSFDKLKGDENYFVGWSLGGMIVAKWSHLYPKDMNGMALITSSSGSNSMPWQRIRPLILPSVIKATLFSKGEKREQGLFDTTCKNESNRAALVKEWKVINDECPVTFMSILRQFIAASMFFSHSFKKQHPVLVLGAPNDQLVNNKSSQALAKFWDAPYKEHPTAGHDIFNDDPEWVAEQLKAFIKA